MAEIDVAAHFTTLINERDSRHALHFSSLEAALKTYMANITDLINERAVSYSQRFDALDGAMRLALLNAEKAVLKAEVANDNRFTAVNEFRGSINDILTRLMPREEASQRFSAMSEKLDMMPALMPRAEADQRFRSLSEKIDLIAQRIDLVSQRLDKSEGTGQGLKSGWGMLISAIGLVATLIAIFAFMTKH